MNSQQEVDWPDWSGETVIVVASGPGADEAPLSAAQGMAKVLVVKENWQLAPWADALYASDGKWWEEHKGVPEFQGLKFSASPYAANLFPEIRLVRLANVARILVDERGLLGCGSRFGNGHSGFHALNLAAQFGPSRIVLVGFDLTLANGPHWHGKPRMVEPTPSLMAEWRVVLDGCAEQFAGLGIEIINASRMSALTAYPKVDLQEIVDGLASASRPDQSRHRVDVEREPVADSPGETVRRVRRRADRRSEGDEQDDSGEAS